MLPILLLLGLGLALAFGETRGGQAKGLPPLPAYDGPPKSQAEADSRKAFLRAIRPDASAYADGYARHTYYVQADHVSGKWSLSKAGQQFAMYVDEYGRLVPGVSGDPLGTMLQAAGYALPFVPGVGPAASAALAAAIAYGKGESLSDAALAGLRGALPRGPAAQAGFDLAIAVANGKPVDEAALDAFLTEVPGAKEGYQKAQEVLG